MGRWAAPAKRRRQAAAAGNCRHEAIRPCLDSQQHAVPDYRRPSPHVAGEVAASAAWPRGSLCCLLDYTLSIPINPALAATAAGCWAGGR